MCIAVAFVDVFLLAGSSCGSASCADCGVSAAVAAGCSDAGGFCPTMLSHVRRNAVLFLSDVFVCSKTHFYFWLTIRLAQSDTCAVDVPLQTRVLPAGSGCGSASCADGGGGGGGGEV